MDPTVSLPDYQTTKMGLCLLSFSHTVGDSRCYESQTRLLLHTSHTLPGVWSLVPHSPQNPAYCTSPPLSFRCATQTHSLSSGIAKAWLGILTLRPTQARDTAQASHKSMHTITPLPAQRLVPRGGSVVRSAGQLVRTHVVSSPDVDSLLKQLLHPLHLIPA